MKSINLNLYQFDELSEAVQEKIISNWRENDEYFWGDENAESLKAFCNLFAIKIKDYEYGYQNYINVKYELDYQIMELSGIKLHKYLVNNYWRDIFKPKYYYKNSKKRLSKIQFQNDCVLTGYYIDNEIMSALYDFIKKPDNSDFESLLNDCLNNWLSACRKDYEYYMSAESIREDIQGGDYLFMANGDLSTKYEAMAA